MVGRISQRCVDSRDDSPICLRVHVRLERTKSDNCIANLNRALQLAREQADKYSVKIRRLLFLLHREAAEEYYKKCLNLQSVASLSMQYFREQRIELRKDLRRGVITNKEYQQKLSPIHKQAKDAEYEAWRYEREGIEEIFGKEAYFMSFDVIETYIIDFKLLTNAQADSQITERSFTPFE